MWNLLGKKKTPADMLRCVYFNTEQHLGYPERSQLALFRGPSAHLRQKGTLKPPHLPDRRPPPPPPPLPPTSENKRMLDKSIRELDRERTNLQNQEKRLVGDIKKMAKAGQMGATKIMAKDLVRTRHSITKFYGLKSQLQGVSLRMQTLKSTQAMADAMRGVTKAMSGMNKQLNLPSLNNIMREFERENEKMENTTEVMGDAIDDAMAADGEEEESEELVAQVLDELGVGMETSLVDAPRTAVKVAAVAAPATQTPVLVAEGANDAGTGGGGGAGIDDDLQARLDNLKRG